MAARHRPAHGHRTASRWAAFLLPHLRPGMRLLDLGCGPGSITVGLGVDAVGVDLEPMAIDAVPVAAADVAAFERCEASAMSQAEGSAEAVGRLARFESSWFAAPEVVAYAVELGAAEADEMAAIADAWARWAEHPSAFVARIWITATGWAPS